MSRIVAAPALRRQLEARELWLFWRDAPGGRGRQGFACLVEACPEPSCPCTEVGLSGLLVDGRLQSVAHRRESRLELVHAAGQMSEEERSGAIRPESCSVAIDFVTGEVAPRHGDEPPPAGVLEWLRGEVDAELLDRLHEAWFAVRGYRWSDWRTAGWDGGTPGSPIGYHEAFPCERYDGFRLGDATYLVNDLHCIDPACDCGRVQIVFGRLQDEELQRGAQGIVVRSNEAGALRLTLPCLEPEAVVPGELTAADVLALWKRCRERHPDLAARLAARDRQMKTVRPQATGRSACVGKVRRNDPCPCGSGAKFKRCCLHRGQGGRLLLPQDEAK